MLINWVYSQHYSICQVFRKSWKVGSIFLRYMLHLRYSPQKWTRFEYSSSFHPRYFSGEIIKRHLGFIIQKNHPIFKDDSPQVYGIASTTHNHLSYSAIFS